MEDEKLKELQGRIVNLELERKQLKEQLAYLEDAFKNVTLMDNADVDTAYSSDGVFQACAK